MDPMRMRTREDNSMEYTIPWRDLTRVDVRGGGDGEWEREK